MYFTEHEFKCNCGCGMDIATELKSAITVAREVAGVPFVITSGARCQAYNDNVVEASPTSSHTKGLAVDIKYQNNHIKFKIMRALILTGFERIGINEDLKFIHVDIDQDKPSELLFGY